MIYFLQGKKYPKTEILFITYKLLHSFDLDTSFTSLSYFLIICTFFNSMIRCVLNCSTNLYLCPSNDDFRSKQYICYLDEKQRLLLSVQNTKNMQLASDEF